MMLNTVLDPRAVEEPFDSSHEADAEELTARSFQDVTLLKNLHLCFIQNKKPIVFTAVVEFGYSMGQNQQIQTQEPELELNSIQDLYNTYITECPSGSLHLHEFKRMFGVKNGTPESQYMDNIFQAFDMNHVSHEWNLLQTTNLFCSSNRANVPRWCFPPFLQDNTMDFIEYVAALHLVLRGRLEDKLRWSFKVFDSDDNGRLDRNEIHKIVQVRGLGFIKALSHVFIISY